MVSGMTDQQNTISEAAPGRHCHGVGYRRSTGNLAPRVLPGLWSAQVAGSCLVRRPANVRTNGQNVGSIIGRRTSRSSDRFPGARLIMSLRQFSVPTCAARTRILSTSTRQARVVPTSATRAKSRFWLRPIRFFGLTSLIPNSS